MIKKHYRTNNSGYIVLISVLLIGAIAVAISVSMLLFGVGSSKMIMQIEESYKTRALANTCAEQTLENLRIDPTITNGNIDIEEMDESNICEYNIIESSNESWEIQIVGKIGDTFKKIRIIANQITPSINITYWKEVADF